MSNKKFKCSECNGRFERAGIHLAFKKNGKQVRFSGVCSVCLVKFGWESSESKR